MLQSTEALGCSATAVAVTDSPLGVFPSAGPASTDSSAMARIEKVGTMSVEPTQLERTALERKDRDELHTIA